jgi:two-component system, OmpR family, sensor histidine kinase PhoQ
MSSLSARLLISVFILLLFFFGATIIALDIAFRDAGEKAQEDILDGQMLALLAAAELNAEGDLEMPLSLREPRFGNLGSGLYADLQDFDGNHVWHSRSSIGLELPHGRIPAVGVQEFSRLLIGDGTPLLTLSLTVQWELPNGELRPYLFHVAESLDSFNAQVARFRGQLFTWFAAIAIILLFSMSLLMRGILRPLRQIEREIGEVEKGGRQSLSEGFPSELSGVARNMNVLIGSERARSERYRQTLDNLAHSLKTPLAAMRSVLTQEKSPKLSDKLEPQIEQMTEIVRYQLRKPAATASDAIGATPVAIEAEIMRLVDGLGKVYLEKQPTIDVSITDDAEFRGDTGDFLELAGNLLDNACKWCESKVSLTIRPVNVDGGMRLTVDDDGPGIPEDAADVLLQRGTRLDESAPGHGIGLAIVRDIANSYGGGISIAVSDFGGASITVDIPPHSAA